MGMSRFCFMHEMMTSCDRLHNQVSTSWSLSCLYINWHRFVEFGARLKALKNTLLEYVRRFWEFSFASRSKRGWWPERTWQWKIRQFLFRVVRSVKQVIFFFFCLSFSRNYGSCSCACRLSFFFFLVYEISLSRSIFVVKIIIKLSIL